MQEPETNHRHSVTIPLVALLIATIAATGLVGLRVLWTDRIAYLFLVGNLALAWLPLVFALAFCRRYDSATRRNWQLASLAALWLLFFPNAPYIFTDVIHLNGWFQHHYWVDLTLILLVAFTGFMLGFLSLYLMQSVVVDRAGQVAGWLFIMAVAALSGFGIYLGRMLRWNSWDVLVNPLGLARSIGHLAVHPVASAPSLAFPALFGVFLFFGYLMLYALTHLQPARSRSR